jgi:hypothetical protein
VRRAASPDGLITRRTTLSAILWLLGVVPWITWAPFVARDRLEPVFFRPTVSSFDIVGNLLLLGPLAVVATVRQWRARTPPSPWRIPLACALLSLTIETVQIYVDGRFPSPRDVLLNAAGAVIAAFATRWVLSRGLRSSIVLGLTLVSVAAAVLGHFVVSARVAPRLLSLSDWNPSYALVSGSERRSPGGADVAHARLCAGDGAARLCVAAGATASELERVVRIAERSQRFEIDAEVALHADQARAAQIIGFGGDSGQLNVALELRGRHLLMKVRTLAGGPQGSRFAFRLRDAVVVGEPTRVVARFDHGNVMLSTRSASHGATGRFRLGLLSSWLLQRALDVVEPQHYVRAEIAAALVILFPIAWLVVEVSARIRTHCRR